MPDGIGRGVSRRRRSRRRRRALGRRVAFSSVFIGLAFVIVMTFSLAAFGAARYLGDLPTLDAVEAREVGANSKVFDRKGRSMGVLANEENRQPVSLDEISPWMAKATVAIEDRRFYEHSGVDPRGIARAMVRNFSAGRIVEGGSTLTQQLISQIYLVKERTYDRKLREAMLAVQLEQRFTKEQILASYMNIVFYGNNAYGVEAAARTYFAKPAKDLEIHEAALIAGLPQFPSAYDPYRHPQAAKNRRAQVLRAMRETGVITREQERVAAASDLGLKRGSIYGKVRESFFVRYVADELAEDPDFSAATVRAGGFDITTTLDPRLQKAARQAMQDVLVTPGGPDAAVVSIRPRTGEIVAMASTRGFRRDQFDLASQSRRQTGSTFKTLTLVTAIEQGINPSATSYLSAPFTWVPDDFSEPWVVSTGSYAGSTTLERGTVASDNTVYAQLAIDVGPPNIVRMARRLGIRDAELAAVPSITLGANGVSPLEMTSAYATLAAGGVYRKPTAIRRVVDDRGTVLIKPRKRGVRVIQDGVAAETTRILSMAMDAGTGRNAKTSDGRPQAGKTGTTDDYTDAWFCGYTPDLATCVWIGYSDATRPMYGVEGVGAVSGPTLPSTIWRLFMESALAGTPARDFPAARNPVQWIEFESIFGALDVPSVVAPEITLEMPKPKPEPEPEPTPEPEPAPETVPEPAPAPAPEPAPEPEPAPATVAEQPVTTG
jgi:penicillin-binding protein 1A